MRQEIVEVTVYEPLPVPDINLTSVSAPKAIKGEMKVLTPDRLKELIRAGEIAERPVVIWAADEKYIRELERWFRGNLSYVEQINAQRNYLLNVINLLKEKSGSPVIDDP